jgi:putative ABC transport system permease protein
MTRWRWEEIVCTVVLCVVLAASVVAFSVTDAALFRSLPYPAPDQLVAIKYGAAGDRPVPSKLRDEMRSRNDLFVGIGADFGAAIAHGLSANDAPIRTSHVSSQLFTVLGVNPVLGSIPFIDESDYCAISETFWSARLARNPQVLGMRLEIGTSTCVVGAVMPNTFFFPTYGTEVWITRTPGIPHSVAALVVGRLLPSVSLSQAKAQLGRLTSGRVGFEPLTIVSYRDSVMAVQDRALSFLLLGIALTFIASGAVVSALQWADALARTNDWCLRRCLGASNIQVFLDVVSGQLRSALVAWIAALVAATLILAVMRNSHNQELWWLAGAELSWRLWLVSAVAVIAIIFSAGFAVTMMVMRIDIGSSIGHGLVHATSQSQRPATIQTIVPVLVSCAVLVVAVAFGFSYRRALFADWGVDSRNVLLAELDVQNRRDLSASDEIKLLDVLVESLRHVPGVEKVAVGHGAVPIRWGGWEVASIATTDVDRRAIPIALWRVGPDFFSALGTPIKSGAEFRSETAMGDARQVILSAAAAARLCQSDCLGKEVSLRFVRTRADADADKRDPLHGHGPPYWTVQSVVSDMKIFGLAASGPPSVFLDDRLNLESRPAARPRLVIRASGIDIAVQGRIRQSVASIPGVSIIELVPLQRVLRQSLGVFGNQAMMASAGIVVALLSLLLASTGIYVSVTGLLQNASRNLAIRLALGASVPALIFAFLGRTFLVMIGGAAAGAALGYVALKRVHAILLPGIPTIQMMVTIGVALSAVVLLPVTALAVKKLRWGELTTTLRQQ